LPKKNKMKSQMSIIFSHPTGNSNSRAAVLGLLEEGILAEFHTSIATFPGSLLEKISVGPLKEIRRRTYNQVLQPYTSMHPFWEAGRMVASKVKLQSLIRHEKGLFSIDAVYQRLDNAVAKKISKLQGLTGVYAYEDGAIQSFKIAKSLGLKRFYDLPIGYWRSSQNFLNLEREKWPEWQSTLTGLIDSQVKLSNKDKEIQEANCIFVASSFTASTLQEFPGKLPPVEIIPYGFPPVNNTRNYHSFDNGRRIKILFVGSLSQRKGIADLFQAVEDLSSKVELTIVGAKPNTTCVALENALLKHRWIPSLSHDKILKLMAENDVFIFPSLFEGFGLVITEAMSQGTPVITTERTAGPDLIVNDENGWLIEAGSSSQLKNAILKLIDNPTIIATAGKAALETARSRPWVVYGNELVQAIKKYY
jgi:glycosyltransferase involved in cell wall biosynthesis